MALYRYVKKVAGVPWPQKRPRHLNIKRAAPLFFIAGLLFVGNALYPIISYQLLMAPKFSNSFISPTAEAEAVLNFGVAPKVLGQEIDLVDFTKAGNWFPESEAVFTKSEEKVYKLSIPKLGINDAEVSVGGDDLKKSLVQFPGTAVPGRFGNTIIFGHSVLPQFFNPKNYLTIFSTLPTLQSKDEIIVDYNQVKYKYVVEKMIQVSPSDTSILAQRYDDSYLTLVTCVPPGTYFKRLIVRARLIKI